MNSCEKILVIDDESSMRHMLRLVLEKNAYQVSEAAHGKEALALLERESYRLILCDLRMPQMDGLEFLDQFASRGHSATIIMMSAYGTLESAIESMKRGAYDFISKPFQADEIILTLKKAEERLGLRDENLVLREELGREIGQLGVICASAAMRRIMEMVAQIAASSHPVLITGETGVGKEVIARALHRCGPRKDAPFVALNCAAVSAGILESELFGHAKGAFTGADRSHEGLFRAADGGVLFLDEIGELPLELQPKLLRVLQEREVRAVGETKTRKVDVQIVTATARNLAEEVRQGRFREDLLFRLNLVEIPVPPLRDRVDDIAPLAEYFLKKAALRDKRSIPVLSEEALSALKGYRWPGNVRELRNFIEKTIIFCRSPRIDIEDLPWQDRRAQRRDEDAFSLKVATERLEREFIRKAMARTGGNKTQAARLLEISLRTLQYKLKDYVME